MSIAPVSSVSSGNPSAAVLRALASSLPSNTAVAAVADTPAQINSEISQLQLDEQSPGSGQSVAQIHQDILQLQEAQKQQAQKQAEQSSSSGVGVVDSASTSGSASSNPAGHLNARA